MSGLRARLFGYLALATAVSAALTVAVAFVLTERSGEREVLANLGRQADAATTALELAGVRSAAQLRVFVVGQRGRFPRRLAGRGQAQPARPRPRLRAALERTEADEGRVRLDGREFAFVKRDTTVGPIALVRSAQPRADEVRPVTGILLIASLGGALVAAALAALVSRRLIRPLRELTEATGPLAAGHGDVRVPVRGEDELADLARAFNAMADELASARDAERRFLMNVSHELKTPLTSVRGYAEALEDGAVAAPVAARTIGTEAARLERLVGDLLDLARLGQREFAVARQSVDLAEVAQEARARHLEQAHARGVALELAVVDEANALGDRDRLVQALSNLVDNGVRVTPRGGRVDIEAGPGRLTVRDTGPGLPEEDLARAFERFHLHARHRAEGSGGSGLGLTIVKELTEAMGGRAGVRSRPGEGTEFVLDLPVRA